MTTKNLGEEGFRWFLGIVEDIAADEKMLGRVKVRILNEHDENVQTEDLALCMVMMPNTSSGVEGVGDTPNLSVGSRVVGFFIDGEEKQLGMIIGTYPIIPDNKDDLHSLSYLARGKQIIQKEPVGPEPASAYGAQYPYNRVITTRSGHVIELDDTPDNSRIHIYHKSGSYLEINNDGQVVLKSLADNFEIVKTNKTLYVGGDLNIETVGVVNIKAKTANITATTTNINGDLKVSGKIDATGEVTGNGIKLSTHKHGGVQSGGSTTSGPQ